MPVLVAVPFVIIAAALLSIVALIVYERMFGSPLEGLARSVPVIGGYLGRGVAAAIRYGRNIIATWVLVSILTPLSWFHALIDAAAGWLAALNAFVVALPGKLDHLAHVTVHEIVKAFVNPVRHIAVDAQADATKALTLGESLARDVEAAFVAEDGLIRAAKREAIAAIREVDIPDVHRYVNSAVAGAEAAGGAAIDDLRGWASGWIDLLQREFDTIPLGRLQDLLVEYAGTAALVGAIAVEAGLGRAECRQKVKGICGTDPQAWEQLLGLAVPLFALPSLGALAEAGAVMLGLLDDAIHAVEA